MRDGQLPQIIIHVYRFLKLLKLLTYLDYSQTSHMKGILHMLLRCWQFVKAYSPGY